MTPRAAPSPRPASTQPAPHDVWRILVDRREQRPLPLAPLAAVQSLPFCTEPATLPTGDYVLDGHAHACIVERKSLPDLLAAVTTSRERFTRELQRLRDETACPVLLVECDLADIAGGNYACSAVRPASVLGTLSSWTLDYGLRVWFGSSPHHAAAAVLRLFAAVRRRALRGEIERQ